MAIQELYLEFLSIRFMHGLKLAGIEMDRKQLSELAIHDECIPMHFFN